MTAVGTRSTTHLGRQPTSAPQLLLLASLVWCSTLATNRATNRADDNSAKTVATNEQSRQEDSFAAELAQLAERCESLQLARPAEITRRWQPPLDPRRQILFLPRAIDHTTPAATAPLVERQWHAKFLAIRKQRAARLWERACQEAQAEQADIAYRTLCEVVREDPEHAEARRVLELPARSATSPIIASSPAVDHPLADWRRGQYWRVRTEHFAIATNHSAGVAQEAARRLEELHDAWRQLFFPFWSTREALRARIAGRNEPLGRRRQHQVVIFKTRDEYVAKLKTIQPQIELTSGYYVDQRKVVFLYVGDETALSSWYHEVAHQLFQESLDFSTVTGGQDGMWMVEGIASYMESLRIYEGYSTVGGPDAARLQYARYAGRRGVFLMPLATLIPLTRDQLQKNAEIRAIYTQSAGHAHFLMDGDQGRWRSAVIAYLFAIYSSRNAPQVLAERLAQPLESLDEKYVEFLNVSDDDVKRFPATPPLKQLSLGRTSVTDRGLTALAPQEKLEWLDLSFLPITDPACERLRGNRSLTQLFLEETKISNQSLKWIGELRELQELDLSGTAITDAGLAHLSRLKNLRQLYLTRCEVTDTGLRSLEGLKQLEVLDLEGTQATPAGIERLRRSLPMWKAAE